MSKLRNALNEADKVKPIAEKNGVKICAPSDARKLIEEELLDPTADLGTRVINPDGSIARSRVLISQVSPERLYDNRFKKQGTKGVGYDELWVVPAVDPKGYRAVVNGMEDKNIPVYLGEMGCSRHSDEDFPYQLYYMEYFCKAAADRLLPMYVWDNGATGVGSEKHGYIDHGTGAFVDEKAKTLIGLMVKAVTTKDPSYTLESVYNSAP